MRFSSQQLPSSAVLLHTPQMFLLLLLHSDFSRSLIDRYFQMCSPISLDRSFLLTKSRSHSCSGFWSIYYRKKQTALHWCVLGGFGNSTHNKYPLHFETLLADFFSWTFPPNSFYSYPISSFSGRMDYRPSVLQSIDIYIKAIFMFTLRLTVKFSSYQIKS